MIFESIGVVKINAIIKRARRPTPRMAEWGINIKAQGTAKRRPGIYCESPLD